MVNLAWTGPLDLCEVVIPWHPRCSQQGKVLFVEGGRSAAIVHALVARSGSSRSLPDLASRSFPLRKIGAARGPERICGGGEIKDDAVRCGMTNLFVGRWVTCANRFEHQISVACHRMTAVAQLRLQALPEKIPRAKTHRPKVSCRFCSSYTAVSYRVVVATA